MASVECDAIVESFQPDTHPRQPLLGDFRVQVGVAVLLAESLLDNGRLPEVLHGVHALRKQQQWQVRCLEAG